MFTREATLENKGTRTLHVESLPSLAWRMPAGRYELSYLWGGWGRERQLTTEKLGPGRRSFVQKRGRSTNGIAAWFCVRNEDLGVRYLARLAWSGNWQAEFNRYPDRRPLEQGDLRVETGMRFDFGGPLALKPGASFTAPPVAFTASAGDLDDAANQLRRYQRQFVIPRLAENDLPLVQFNSWFPFPGKLTAADMPRCADIAVNLGAEVFVLDAGWYSRENWGLELRDWRADPVAFPNGVEELARYVRTKGMKFGIWLEIENLGTASRMFREHADWCLTYNGRPLEVFSRAHLDFAKPEVRQWARTVVDRVVPDYGVDWVKIDYNIDIGDQFDAGPDRSGDVLYRHLAAYYAWLDELRAAYPRLVIENCASGGLRFDLGMLARTHTSWISDEVRPLPSLALAYGCTVEFAPEVCNYWMVGDDDRRNVRPSGTEGWWDFMLRVPMNGQFGISSRVFDWSPALRKRAAEQVALYKVSVR